jgi:DNA-binding response OmpR family regulator
LGGFADRAHSIIHPMLAATKEPPRSRSAVRRAAMPARMRALYVTTSSRTGGWLAEALANDSASDVQLDEAIGVTAGLAKLRDEVFDLVLIVHEPAELDAPELVEGLRAGGNDEPILVLGIASEQEMAALCFEVGADAYLCVNTTTTRTLLWAAARAIERHELLRENRRLLQADRQRLQQEHLEADRLLAEQRALVTDLESLSASDDLASKTAARTNKSRGANRPASSTHQKPPEVELVRLPENLVAHYRELLRAFVIMGSGNLAADMKELSELLVNTGVTPQQVMLLHLKVVEELVRGLGSRSARHVMTRADLLVLEIMIHLADGYRHRFLESVHPPQQRWLPGFDASGVAR